jgi:hypothetical protein
MWKVYVTWRLKRKETRVQKPLRYMGGVPAAQPTIDELKIWFKNGLMANIAIVTGVFIITMWISIVLRLSSMQRNNFRFPLVK